MCLACLVLNVPLPIYAILCCHIVQWECFMLVCWTAYTCQCMHYYYELHALSITWFTVNRLVATSGVASNKFSWWCWHFHGLGVCEEKNRLANMQDSVYSLLTLFINFNGRRLCSCIRKLARNKKKAYFVILGNISRWWGGWSPISHPSGYTPGLSVQVLRSILKEEKGVLFQLPSDGSMTVTFMFRVASVGKGTTRRAGVLWYTFSW